jgi:predicted ester cyclase
MPTGTATIEHNKELVRRIVDEMFNLGKLNVAAALPDIKATIQNLVAEGDYVAMWNTATATHVGELFGMPGSGKRINMKDFHFFRFSNGQIVEHWNQVGID